MTADRVRPNRGIRYAPMTAARPHFCAFSGRLHMAPRRLSRLQRHILKHVIAEDRRTQGRVIMGHFALVQL